MTAEGSAGTFPKFFQFHLRKYLAEKEAVLFRVKDTIINLERTNTQYTNLSRPVFVCDYFTFLMESVLFPL